MLDTGKDVQLYWEQLRTNRATFEDTWQQIADNVLGLRDFNQVHIEKGRQRMRRIYDTTGMQMGGLLAGSLHGLLFNPAGRWHDISVHPQELLQSDDASRWIAELNTATNHVFKSAEFGFAAAVGEMLIDYVHFGTGDIYIEDMPGFGPLYSSHPLGEVYVDNDAHGRVQRVFRRFRLSRSAAREEYGDRLSPAMLRQAEVSPTEDTWFLQVVHPRADLKKQGRDPRPIRSVTVEMEGATVLRESGFWTMPFLVGRWGKESNEMYGRGPAFNSLSDCKMLNEMGRVIIEQSQKLLAPPIFVPDDGVLTQVDTSPDALIVYRAGVFKDDPLRLMPVSDKTLVSERLIEQRQKSVERAFFGHLLDLFSEPTLTATQSVQMEGKAARILVSEIARAANEVADPCIRRTVDILERGGFVSPRPDSLQDVPLVITYISPIMRNQQQQEVRSIMEVWGAAFQLVEGGVPEAQDWLDPDASMKWIADSQSVPKEVIRSDEVVAIIREMRAKQQQEAAEQAQMAQMAESAGKVLPGAAAMQEAGGTENLQQPS